MKNKTALLTTLSLLLLLIAEITLNFPTFVHTRVNNPGSLQGFELKRQSNIFEFDLKPQEETKLNITTNQSALLSVYVDGTKKDYKNTPNGIQITIPKKQWGKSNILLKRESLFLKFLKLIALICLTIVLLIPLKKTSKSYLTVVLLSFSLLYLTHYIAINLDQILEVTDVKKLSYRYQRSQYVMGQGSDEVVEDEVPYTLAGYHYAVDGADPSAIDFEHPPLAKYIYGYSIKWFKRARVMSLMFYLFILITLVSSSRIIFKDNFTSLIALTLFILEKETISHITTATLDLPLTAFLMTSFAFYLLGKQKGKFNYYLASSLCIGCAAAAKIYFTAIIFTALLVIDLFINKRKDTILFLTSLLAGAAVFIITYSKYFHKHSVSEFIALQKWIISWYRGKPDLGGRGTIFQTLLLGKVTAWWQFDKGRLISIKNWSPLWSIYGIMLLASNASIVTTRKFRFLAVWPFAYMIFLSLGAFSANLLVAIFPFLILNYLSVIQILKTNKQAKKK